MFTLVTDRSKYYRVKRGQGAREIENTLLTPAGEVFCGAIIAVYPRKLFIYNVLPHETYQSVARKFGADCEELEKINGGALYPTRKLFVPCK